MNAPLTVEQREVLRELVARDLLKRKLAAALHPKQRRFAFSKSKKSAAQAGRRGGKSTGLAGKFIKTAVENPEGLSVFIAISAARANEIIGSALHKLGRAIDFEPKPTTKDGQLYWLFPNGHRLWVAGCKTRAEAEKFRGSPYCGAAIDEADSIRNHLQYLVEDVLDWALLDLDGWLALTGTPGATPVGYFHAVTTGEDGIRQWETHHWTCLDNPHLKDAAGWLKRRCEELGLSDASPTFRREFLGEWVRDLDALCYPYDPERNAIHGPLDGHDWRYLIAIDLGVVDATAIVVLAYRDRDPNIHVVWSRSWSGLSPSQAGLKVNEVKARYPGARLVADTGGIGRGFTQEWAIRYGIATEAAHKADATAQIALAGDLVRAGTVKVHLPEAESLAKEWSILPWDIDRTGHDPAYADHESSACRYGLMAVRPLRALHDVPPPPPGSPAAEAIAEAERRRAVFREAERGRKGRR